MEGFVGDLIVTTPLCTQVYCSALREDGGEDSCGDPNKFPVSASP
jgi:hypothetical protein